jgi:hypothetical protein
MSICQSAHLLEWSEAGWLEVKGSLAKQQFQRSNLTVSK